MELEVRENEWNDVTYRTYMISSLNKFGKGLKVGDYIIGTVKFDPKITHMEEIDGKWCKVDVINKKAEKRFTTCVMDIKPSESTMNNIKDIVLNKYGNITIQVTGDIAYDKITKIGVKDKTLLFECKAYKSKSGKDCVIIDITSIENADIDLSYQEKPITETEIKIAKQVFEQDGSENDLLIILQNYFDKKENDVFKPSNKRLLMIKEMLR